MTRPARLALPLLLAAACTLSAQTPRRPAKTAPKTASKTAADPDLSIPLEGRPWPIESLTVKGNHIYTAQQVLAAAQLHKGDTAGKAEFDAARDRLAATGAFDKVDYQFVPAKDLKGYDATFEVVEQPQVFPMRFEELPAAEADLRAWLAKKDPLFAEKIPGTRAELDRYVKWIEEYLAAQNHAMSVSGQLTSESAPALAILFRPAAARPNVTRVLFTNTGDIPAATLQSAMNGVAIGVPFTEPQLRLLLDNTARPIYEAKGFIRVAFPKVSAEPSKDVSGVDVSVDVQQGPAYTLAKVQFFGDDNSPESLTKLANLKTSQTADFDQVKAAQDRIAQSLKRRGYLDNTSIVKRAIDDKEHTVALTFEIEPGPLYTLGKLDIIGLNIETEPPVRKMWAIQPGRPFNPEYPDRFLDRVKNGGVFDNLKTTRAETKIDKATHTVDVTLYFNR